MVRSSSPPPRASLPPRAGIGLKGEHCQDVLDGRPDVAFFEIHTENYMGDGGAPHRCLAEIAGLYPLSMHGVGLSLGSADGLDARHLDRKAALVEAYRPALVSEHLSWSVAGGVYLNDLLPLPYTTETLALIADHVAQAQDRLGRRLLIENPSTYLRFRESTLPETEFLNRLCAATGCGLLLDVNNVYVSAWNHAFDPRDYLYALRHAPVGEFHLAGHHHAAVDGLQRGLRIDDHGSAVCPEVWDLFVTALALFGPRPTLIEWDSDLPGLATWVGEAAKADALLAEAAADAA